MQTIFKYPLGFSAANHLDMPVGSRPVMVAMQNGQVTMWAQVDPDFETTTKRDFVVAGTGHPVPDDYVHVGSCMDGMFVWHVFETGRGSA